MPQAGGRSLPGLRLGRFARSLFNVRAYLHFFRILHFYAYSHVNEKPLMTIGPRTGFAPNVSIVNGRRITIGHDCHIGERCYLWAGNTSGKITIGNFVSLAPEVFITASDYQFKAGLRFREQPKRERDVVIGSDVWLGARVIVTAGAIIGDGCIIGAGSVVTREIPSNSIAVGAPARVVAMRGEGDSPQ